MARRESVGKAGEHRAWRQMLRMFLVWMSGKMADH